jgi:hypothetical protein
MDRRATIEKIITEISVLNKHIENMMRAYRSVDRLGLPWEAEEMKKMLKTEWRRAEAAIVQLKEELALLKD